MPIQTNPNYWDCNCAQNYIHPTRQEYCGRCHTARIGQPASRQNEIKQMRIQKSTEEQ